VFEPDNSRFCTMRVTRVCLSLFQFAAVAHGQCACTTTAEPQNTTVATTTEMAAPPSSSGPSSGPGRLLLDSLDLYDNYDLENIDRQLQDDNSSDGNSSDDVVTSTASTLVTETSDADSCACPLPQVVATFTATLSGLSPTDVAELDFEAIKASLAEAENWGDDVEVVAVVKIGFQYTLDVEITDAQCKAAVAVAYSVAEDDVECGTGSAATSNATSNATRRLQEVMDVTIIVDQTEAEEAATTSQAADTTLAFVTALEGEGLTVVVEVSEATVSVELMFTVTTSEAITEPSVASFEGAVASSAPDVTFTTAISGFETAFDRMPCSEFDCGSDSNVDELRGCDGAVCTAVESDRCCESRPAQANAQGICVAGSLLPILIWNFF